MGCLVQIKLGRRTIWEHAYSSWGRAARSFWPGGAPYMRPKDPENARIPREACREVVKALAEAAYNGWPTAPIAIFVDGVKVPSTDYPYRDPQRASESWRYGCPNTYMPRRAGRDMWRLSANGSDRPVKTKSQPSVRASAGRTRVARAVSLSRAGQG